MGIKVIGFDLDDTLWEMRPTLLRAESRLEAWLEDTCPNMRLSGEEMGELRRRVVREQPELRTSISELRRRVIEAALLVSGYEDATARSHDAFEVFLQARHDVFWFEGALDVLAELSRSYRLGSLTNGNADIARLGLASTFSFALCAEQIGAMKPDPGLFLHALRETGVAPAEMVYVGDDAKLDIDAAYDVGLRTVWVNRSGEAFDGLRSPSSEISDIRQLPAAVAALEADG